MSTERIVFLNRLREGVSREAADRFLLERDIPLGRSLPSITRYEVVRVGDGAFDYVDVIEVTSIADYHRDIAALEGTDEWEAFVAEWSRVIDADLSLTIFGERLG